MKTIECVRKCDHCKNEALYICDYLDSRNVWHPFAGCDEHKFEALYEQNSFAQGDKINNLRFRNYQNVTVNTELT